MWAKNKLKYLILLLYINMPLINVYSNIALAKLDPKYFKYYILIINLILYFYSKKGYLGGFWAEKQRERSDIIIISKSKRFFKMLQSTPVKHSLLESSKLILQIT